MKKIISEIFYFIIGLTIFLFFRISFWMVSIPAWVTLILHFTIDLHIKWFWLTLAAWIVAGIIRYIVFRLAMWGDEGRPEYPSVNPYAYRNTKDRKDGYFEKKK